MCVQALEELQGHVEEIPCVVGGKEIFTGNVQKQVSVSAIDYSPLMWYNTSFDRFPWFIYTVYMYIIYCMIGGNIQCTCTCI